MTRRLVLALIAISTASLLMRGAPVPPVVRLRLEPGMVPADPPIICPGGKTTIRFSANLVDPNRKNEEDKPVAKSQTYEIKTDTGKIQAVTGFNGFKQTPPDLSKTPAAVKEEKNNSVGPGECTAVISFDTTGTKTITITGTINDGKPQTIQIQVLVTDAKIAIRRLSSWSEEINGIRRPAPGSTVRFIATACPFNQKVRFKFTLIGTSQEPGVNMNTTTGKEFKSDGREYDLTFEKQAGYNDPKGAKQEIEQTEATGNSATVAVTSHDYGPYGTIKAEIVGDPKAVTEPLAVLEDRMPAGGNHIEDAWDAAFPPPAAGTLSRTDDNDDTPKGNGQNGDLLTRYEEYRGFNTIDVHGKVKYASTNPARKTVFLRDLTGYQPADKKSVLRLFSKLDCEVHFVGDKQTDARRHINFNNGRTLQRAIFVQKTNKAGTDDALGLTRGRLPSNYDFCRVWVEGHLLQMTLEIAIDQKNTAGLVYRENQDTEQDVWRDKGRIKLDGEIIGYREGVPSNTTFENAKTALVAVPADSTSVITDRFPASRFVYVRIGDEVMHSRDAARQKRGFKIEATAKGANQIVTDLDTVADPNGKFYVYARLDDGKKTEWISYTGVKEAKNNGFVLTDVKRGQLGTLDIAHDANTALFIPWQMTDCQRGQLGTKAVPIATNQKVIPVGVLLDLTRGNPPAPHAATAKFGVYSQPDDALRQTCAHEAGHAVGLTHDGGEIMSISINRGSFLGNGLFDSFSNFSKGEFNAR